MKVTLYVLACVALTALFLACASQPAGQYSAAQVAQGLKDAVSSNVISQVQADAVGGKIASATTGFPWSETLTGIGSVVTTLALGYVGIRKADNKHIIGADEAEALAELVASRKAA